MKKKTYSFKSEIKELLNIMINSLYSNKEIFLRELISNSSDAIDKIKFYNIKSKVNDINNLNKNYFIKIYIDNNNLIISDNGIGMTKKELINNLGKIAKSGTKKFLDKYINLNKKDNINMIGQFGVGFYSSFMVSDKVLVHTKSIIGKYGYLWSSSGHGKYTIIKKFKDNVGTDIILNIKNSCKEFLDNSNIEKVVIKYSNYINIPIKLKYFDKKENKYIYKKINQSYALWTKDKKDISNKEYIDFYNSLTNNLGNPLIWSHNKVEGKNEYISLIYIPSISPWNIWNRDEYKNGIKLYINKVFIMEGITKIVPFYLRFVQGIIDTNDLSLNVSREILQDSNFINILRISITNKVINMLNKLSLDKDKYCIFWKEFGNIFKEGLAEDEINRYKISLLLRFCSTHNSSKNEYISLEDYLNRMIPGQDKIFYIISDNYYSAFNSPHLEIYRKKNIEVLLMFNRIDEWMMSYLNDFKGIKFCSINKSNVDSNIITINKSIISCSTNNNNLDKFILRVKNVLSKYDIKDVILTNKLDTFPVVVTTSNNDISTQMSKLLSSIGKSVPKVKYLLEINPNHILIKYVNSIIDNDLFKKWVNYLFYQALLIETNSLDNPAKFINIINNILCKLIIK